MGIEGSEWKRARLRLRAKKASCAAIDLQGPERLQKVTESSDVELWTTSLQLSFAHDGEFDEALMPRSEVRRGERANARGEL